jgi:nucleoid-associated protein YgaU
MKRLKPAQKPFDKFHIDVSYEESLLFQEPIVSTPLKDRLNFMNIKTISIVAAVHVLPLAMIMAKSVPEKNEPVPEIPSVAPLPPTPSPTPVPLPKPPAPSSTNTATTAYTVKQGDTITKIVKKYKLSTKSLLELNHIKDPNSIKVGQVLKFTR